MRALLFRPVASVTVPVRRLVGVERGHRIRERSGSGVTRAGEAQPEVVVAVAGRVVVAVRRPHVARVVVPAAAPFDPVLPPPAKPPHIYHTDRSPTIHLKKNGRFAEPALSLPNGPARSGRSLLA